MKDYFDILKNTQLFAGYQDDDIAAVLKCLKPVEKNFQNNEIILPAGEYVKSLGILLDGNIQIIKEDFLGNRTIIADLRPGELFGESLAGMEEKSPVAAVAAEKCGVLFLEFDKIAHLCAAACGYHSSLIENLLRLVRRKNIYLNQKLDILSCRTTREKLLRYFAYFVGAGDKYFEIPFTRDELADYLCVNRSALSRELGAMRAEGILDFNRNQFRLYTENRE